MKQVRQGAAGMEQRQQAVQGRGHPAPERVGPTAARQYWWAQGARAASGRSREEGPEAWLDSQQLAAHPWRGDPHQ